MKIFKTLDQKIKDLGFTLVANNKSAIRYERYNEKNKYIQVVELHYKKNGNHILESYDPCLFDEKGIGNTCIGLTYKETKLFLKKMKEKGWN